jgi:hypothetical protein
VDFLPGDESSGIPKDFLLDRVLRYRCQAFGGERGELPLAPSSMVPPVSESEVVGTWVCAALF